MLIDKLIFTPEQNSGRPGAWLSGRFIFWGTSLHTAVIRLGRLKEKIDYLLRLFNWLLVFAGWLAGGAWLWRHSAAFMAQPLSLFFPHVFDPLIFIFVLSLWFDLFLVYSVSRERLAAQKINLKLFVETASNKSRANQKTGRKYNVATAYSATSFKIVEDAYLLANKLHQSEVEIIHLFRVLLKNKEIQNLFIRLDVNAKKLVELVDHHLVKPTDKKRLVHLELSEALQQVLVSAFAEACSLRQTSVDVLDLITFCYDGDSALSEILYELEVDADKIQNTVAWFRVNQRLVENYRNYRRLALLKPSTNMNRAYTAIATPTLDHFGHDLTVDAKVGNLEVCVSRQKEIQSIFEAFSGGHNGVLLVGATGVGKQAIVDGLAQLMVEENVPAFLKDKRLVELDVARLLAGADASQAQERLLTSINEIARSGNIILYVDNIEHLIGISAGAQESLDVSEVLAEAINRHQIYCLATANTENYAHYIENKSLGNVLTTIGVEEPSTNEAIQILESKVGVLENKYDVYIVYSALEQAVVMSTRYLHDKFLPLKAINLLEKAAIVAANNMKADPAKCFCGREEVAAAISELTGIPASKVTVSESQKLLSLETEIHKRLVGQSEAVDAVAASLRRARAELKDSKRPIASFLFLGPTGVGKTELAKSVSEVYFGDENYLIRLDMSEYQSADSIKKMIGDVDGTLGYLTEAVRKKPFSLVLLDEIEKANPDILNLFLQLLDDGRLTDGQGRTISFAESIIIATSNIGAVYIEDQIKANVSINLIKQELIDNQLNKYMRPELINRFDGIIVFKPLTPGDVFTIATLMLKKIKQNLANKGIGLKADKDGVEVLAQEGYDPKFGARPLRRLLQDKIEDAIATKILSGELKRRDTVIINGQAAIEIDKAQSL
jgi:ATP-dependent Clp protease ATP-binding subunit ClpC